MKEFLTKSEFTRIVEKEVSEKKIGYMEAVLLICEENDIDPQDSKKFISAPIREKIECEAMNLNLLPKGNQLSFD